MANCCEDMLPMQISKFGGFACKYVISKVKWVLKVAPNPCQASCWVSKMITMVIKNQIPSYYI